MLGAAFSFIMLGFGGAGGLINMSYQLDSTIHNTQWITGHFHLIFGGAIVIMYFVIAYDIWPHLTGRALDSFRLMRLQLWTWFVGMIVLTFPWHYVGILGMPRRMAFYDYKDPMIAPQAASVTMSVVGGAILVVSGALFLLVLARGQRAPRVEPGRLSLQPRRASPAAPAGGAERLRALARFDGGADPRELWLPHRPSPGDPGYRGAGDRGGGAAMSRRDGWVATSVGITAAIAIAGAIVGFAWLPLAQPAERFGSLWEAICSAAGLVQPARSEDRWSRPIIRPPASRSCRRC